MRAFGLLSILVFSLTAFSKETRHCPPVKIRGFTYKTTKSGIDRYGSAKGVLMQVKCPPATITSDDLIKRYKSESSPRNTIGDAVYFEFDLERRFKRVYVITRRPTFELTFTIRYRKRALLNETENLVVAAYPKLK